MNNDRRINRRLIRIGYPSEVPDLAGESALVKPLRIPRSKNVDRAIHVDFHEPPNPALHFFAGIAIWRDRSDYDDHAVTRKQLRHKADAPDIRVAIFTRIAETLRKIRANDIAIEDLHFGALLA